MDPEKLIKELIKASKFKEHCDDPENCECCRKKWQRMNTIHALAFFIVGILFNYAPQYIGTQDNWIINKGDTGGYVSLIFFAIGIYGLYCAYPRLFTYLNGYFLFLSMGMSLYYATARTDISPEVRESFREICKAISFGCLAITIISIAMISPRLMDQWEENKKNIKLLFKPKNISGVTLGVLTMGTALFQFLQVLFSFIHH